MYYRFSVGTMVGDKFLCVVVKIVGDEAFVLTAYLTDRESREEFSYGRKKPEDLV